MMFNILDSNLKIKRIPMNCWHSFVNFQMSCSSGIKRSIINDFILQTCIHMIQYYYGTELKVV